MIATTKEFEEGRRRIRVEITADTAEEAEAARQRYLADKPPLGYDTYLEAPRLGAGGRWTVLGRRARSCD